MADELVRIRRPPGCLHDCTAQLRCGEVLQIPCRQLILMPLGVLLDAVAIHAVFSLPYGFRIESRNTM
jgi:hypothetical protein